MSKKNHSPKTFKGLHLTATLSMSLVLFLIGLVSLLVFVAHDMSVYVRENINLSVILDDHINQAYVNRIEKYLNNAPFTKSVEYISKEDALKDHIASLGENPQDFLGYNPLKASLEVKLKAAYANNDSVSIIEKKLNTFEHVSRIVYQKDLVSLVNENVRKVSYVLLGIAFILLIVSITLINNTVRLSIYSNRFLINTMKLVGATNWFIRKPYIARSVLNGIIAALISIFLLAGVVYYVMYGFGLHELELSIISILSVAVIVVASGIILTAVASFMAVGRYLHMRTNDMYFI